MYAFTYERPATAADAARLAQAGGKLLAGGQTLLASMKLRLAAPEQLVDLGAVAELKGIRREAGTLTIGAMTRHCDVAESAEVRADIPALAELASHIGDKQVRAMGTLGGSVANNDPAADYPAALMALGATVHTSKRQIKADDFFQGLFATALDEGELITAIGFPIPKRAAYVKFAQPASRFALIGVFVAVFYSQQGAYLFDRLPAAGRHGQLDQIAQGTHRATVCAFQVFPLPALDNAFQQLEQEARVAAVLSQFGV